MCRHLPATAKPAQNQCPKGRYELAERTRAIVAGGIGVAQTTESLGEPRLNAWQQQPNSFFDLPIIEGHGTMVETSG